MAQKNEEVLDVVVRHLEPGDVYFIHNSWMKSYQDSAFIRDKDNYYKFIKMTFAKILLRNPVVRVAADPTDKSHILGWLIAQPPVLHYLYVKAPYRRQGIAYQLIAATALARQPTIACTFWTPYASAVNNHKPGILINCSL